MDYWFSIRKGLFVSWGQFINDWRKLPNLISLIRCMIGVLAVAVYYFSSSEEALVFAFIAIIVSISLDGVDGWAARKYRLITPTGEWLDPFCDKITVCAGLFCVALKLSSFLILIVALIVLAREFAVTVLRFYAAEKGQSIPAMNLGKVKMVAQSTLVIILMLPEKLIIDLIGQPIVQLMDIWWLYVVPIMAVIVVALTIISGVEYFQKYYAGIERSKRLRTLQQQHQRSI